MIHPSRATCRPAPDRVPIQTTCQATHGVPKGVVFGNHELDEPTRSRLYRAPLAGVLGLGWQPRGALRNARAIRSWESRSIVRQLPRRVPRYCVSNIRYWSRSGV